MQVAELSKYGISQTLIKKLKEQGYDTLTTVQHSAVESGLFERKNILVIAPTNTGKTFVGELAALAASTRTQATHTFFLVPLKALAEEKFQDFTNKYAKWGLRIAISTGERTDFDDDLLSHQVIITTYEKMNAILVRVPKLIDHVGVVVVDELQNMGDPTRGVTLEILLTTLLNSKPRPQIIGLSATVSNPKQVADWLDAVLVETSKRDVELREGVIYSGVEDVELQGVSVGKGDFVFREFNSGVVGIEKGLRFDTVQGLDNASLKEQILVFVRTHKEAEDMAERLASNLASLSGVTEVIERLDRAVESTPSTRILKDTIQSGVAFHHAGLLPEERLVVEDSFDKGLVRIVCATTTLSAGVNTPAKNVVFLSHQTFDEKNIKTRDYKNMAGRAGRLRSTDAFGRSVLLAENERELQMLWTGYVTARTEPLRSQIGGSERLDLAVLGLLSSKVCNDVESLLAFIRSTFFGHSSYRLTSDPLKKTFDESIIIRLKALEKNGFVTISNERVAVTELGKRSAEEMLSPSTAILLYKALRTLETRLATQNDYSKLIAPIIQLACSCSDADGALLWWPRFPSEQKKLAEEWESTKSEFLSTPENDVLLIRALKTTHMFADWIQGASYADLSSYAGHGIIKRDAETVSWIVGGLARIAEKPLFNFKHGFVRFLRILSERLLYGVPESALPVMRMRIPIANRHRAMALATVGFTSIDKIIDAKPEELMKAKGIGEKEALEIKKSVEKHIEDKLLVAYHRQRRLAQTLGKNPTIIDRLYQEKGDNFARAFNDIFKDHFGLKSAFVGDASQHEVDVVIETNKGKIVVEGKRIENKNVSATQAEEVVGKGAKHSPIAYVTVGYPDFSDEAKKNCSKAKVTLISAPVLGEILLAFWQDEINRERIMEILMSAQQVDDPHQERKEMSLVPA